MSLPRAAAALTLAAILAGCAAPGAGPGPNGYSSREPSPGDGTRKPVPPALSWLASPGGQAQVTLADDTDTLAAALYTESQSPTPANHRAFAAAGAAVAAQARHILGDPALLPAHPAAYERELRDWITVAGLLQPGPGYGTAAQDYTAWYRALRASDISVY